MRSRNLPLQDLLLPAALLCAIPGTTGPAVTGDATFTLHAEWSPIARSKYEFHLDEASGLASVLDPGPARPAATYGWNAIAPLLPPPGTSVGDVWEPDVEPVVALVRQLHPSATWRMHHHHMPVDFGPDAPDDLQASPEQVRALPGAPLGARATLLGDGETVDVLLRAHIEFHLRDGTVFYTPAQFEGRLVVDVAEKRVRAFHLAVPDRDTNVDLNVHDEDEEYGVADIGYVPRLGLWTDAAPPAREEAELFAARDRLRRAFYPFAAANWVPLDEAVEASRRTGRPMHVIVLFGALDDESC